uniref:Uncharacterized protein n=1 Tax=Arundo donax TaxID=35708 RepID=A0A0A8Z603_ARUDO
MACMIGGGPVTSLAPSRSKLLSDTCISRVTFLRSNSMRPLRTPSSGAGRRTGALSQVGRNLGPP